MSSSSSSDCDAARHCRRPPTPSGKSGGASLFSGHHQQQQRLATAFRPQSASIGGFRSNNSAVVGKASGIAFGSRPSSAASQRQVGPHSKNSNITTAEQPTIAVITSVTAPLPLRPATIAVSADGTQIPTATATGQPAASSFASPLCRSTLIVPVGEDIRTFGVIGGGGASSTAVPNHGGHGGSRPASADSAIPRYMLGVASKGGAVSRPQSAMSVVSEGQDATRRGRGPQAAVMAARGTANVSSRPTSAAASAAHHRSNSQPAAERTFTGRPISAMARFPRCATESIGDLALGEAPSSSSPPTGTTATTVLDASSAAPFYANASSVSTAAPHQQQQQRTQRGGGFDAFGRLANPIAAAGAAVRCGPLATSALAVPSAAPLSDASVVGLPAMDGSIGSAYGHTNGLCGSHDSFGAALGGERPITAREFLNSSSAHYTNGPSSPSALASTAGGRNTSALGISLSADAAQANGPFGGNDEEHVVGGPHSRPHCSLDSVEQNLRITHSRDVRIASSAVGGGLESRADAGCTHSIAAQKRRGNGWFAMNRSPAEGLRRGTPMWAGPVGGGPAAVSLLHGKAYDQQNASRNAQLKQRQLLTEPIRSRVPHKVKGGLGATSSNVSLMQGAVRRAGAGSRASSVTSLGLGIGDGEEGSMQLSRNSRGLFMAPSSSSADGNGSSKKGKRPSAADIADGHFYGHSATAAPMVGAVAALEVNALDGWVPAKSLTEEVANAVTAMWSGKRRQPLIHPAVSDDEEGEVGGEGNSAGRGQGGDTNSQSGRSKGVVSFATGAPARGRAKAVARMSSYAAAAALPTSASRTHTIDSYAYADDSSGDEGAAGGSGEVDYQQAFNNISYRRHRGDSVAGGESAVSPASASASGSPSKAAAAEKAGAIAASFAHVGAASSDPVARAAYFRSVITGPVGLPTYRTSRYLAHASVSWDVVMEAPLEVTQRILDERARFEKW